MPANPKKKTFVVSLPFTIIHSNFFLLNIISPLMNSAKLDFERTCPRKTYMKSLLSTSSVPPIPSLDSSTGSSDRDHLIIPVFKSGDMSSVRNYRPALSFYFAQYLRFWKSSYTTKSLTLCLLQSLLLSLGFNLGIPQLNNCWFFSILSSTPLPLPPPPKQMLFISISGRRLTVSLIMNFLPSSGHL